MSLKNIMLRWSKPTTQEEKRNFNLYSSAIERYSVATWLTQATLGAVAYIPIVMVLEYILPPQFHHSIWWVAIAVIALLHYVLHYEGIELIGAVMEKLKMRWYDWCVPLATVVIFFTADIFGGQASFADMLSDKSKFTINNDSLMRVDGSRAESEFRNDTAQLARSRDAALLMASANRNEDWVKNAQIKDLKSRNMDGAAITSLYRKAVAGIESKFEDGVKEAKKMRDGKLADAKSEVKSNKDNKELYAKTVERSANNRSWIVTAIGWLLYTLFSIRLTALRLRCGIRRQTHFGDLDAQGGVWEKIMMVIKDAWKRQSHKATQWMHVKLTTGTTELVALNNRVRVVASPTPQENDENDDLEDDLNVSRHVVTNPNTTPSVVTNPNTIASTRAEEDVEIESIALDSEVFGIVTTEQNPVTTEQNSAEQRIGAMQIETSIGIRTIDAFVDLIRRAHERSGGNENDEKLVLRRGELYYYLRGDAALKMFHWCIRNKAIAGERCYKLSKSALNTMQRFGMDGANDSESELELA